MCIITVIPANVEIPTKAIENGADHNRDGHGWAVASTAGIQVGKSMDFNDAFRTFEKARAEHGPSSVALFHSRIATAGTVDEFNVHPFYVTEDTVMAHNGIMPNVWQPEHKFERRSDTQIFNERVLVHYIRPDTGLPSRRGARSLGQLIGNGNKLAILTAHGGKPKVRIVNAHLGEHAYGCWFSNSWYCTIGSGWSYSPNPVKIGGEDDKWLGNWSPADYEDAPCEVCGVALAVPLDTSICEVCNTCNTCWASAEECDCLFGGSYYRMIEEKEQARYEQEMIDAAAEAADREVMDQVERERGLELWKGWMQ